MSYTFDPAALHAVAQQAAGLQLPSDELITRTVELLAEQYPDHIDAGPGRWVGSKAGGVSRDRTALAGIAMRIAEAMVLLLSPRLDPRPINTMEKFPLLAAHVWTPIL